MAAELNEYAYLFSVDADESRQHLHRPTPQQIQQFMKDVLQQPTTSASQTWRLQTPQQTPERTTNAPAFPSPKPLRIPFNFATTSSLPVPFQPQTSGTKRKPGRPAKVPVVSEIPVLPRLNLSSESGGPLNTSAPTNQNLPGNLPLERIRRLSAVGNGNAGAAALTSSQTALPYGPPLNASYGGHSSNGQHLMPSSPSTVQPLVPTRTSTWQPQQMQSAFNHSDLEAYLNICNELLLTKCTSRVNNIIEENLLKNSQKRELTPPNESEIEQTEPPRKRLRTSEQAGFKPADVLVGTLPLKLNIGNSQPAEKPQVQSSQETPTPASARKAKAPLKRPRPLAPSKPPTPPPTSLPSPPGTPLRLPLPCLPLSPVLLHPDPELEPYSDPALAFLPLPVFDAEYRPLEMTSEEYVNALLEVRGAQVHLLPEDSEDEIIQRTAL